MAEENAWKINGSKDPLTEVLRQGAQRLLAPAIAADIAVLLAQYAHHRDLPDRQAVIQNGYLPEREVQTAIGAARVKRPWVRDRRGLKMRFHSALLPPYPGLACELLPNGGGFQSRTGSHGQPS
jgi:putative transposase